MIADKGQAKIMDFGLAKLKGHSKLTKFGTTVGTSAYMSPEQTTGKDVDHRTDIWSFGVVLYEMITGQKPFKGEYECAIMYSVLNEEQQDVKKLQPNCPDFLADVVTFCLQKEAGKRFVSVWPQLRNDLWDSGFLVSGSLRGRGSELPGHGFGGVSRTLPVSNGFRALHGRLRMRGGS